MGALGLNAKLGLNIVINGDIGVGIVIRSVVLLIVVLGVFVRAPRDAVAEGRGPLLGEERLEAVEESRKESESRNEWSTKT